MSKSKGPSRAGNYGASTCRTAATAPGGVKQYPPISAKIKGPGAGKYGRQPCTGIRNHDFTMFAEPAYTMHIKHTEKILADTVSPGACFVDPHLSRFGWWKPSSFRIQNREKSLRTHCTPSVLFRNGPRYWNSSSERGALVELWETQDWKSTRIMLALGCPGGEDANAEGSVHAAKGGEGCATIALADVLPLLSCYPLHDPLCLSQQTLLGVNDLTCQEH
ncbi:actin-like protein 6A [Platysternon megacephalum]|uniref:Actin-like protein 6A n=1 Tax=Platysternon megacephalum TaxID=55544 RepID=A0A4D9E807_9SAUR|nr:actin-like protein 6A [Platysternon megacephalum]